MMKREVDVLLADMRASIAELAQDGGLMTPSIYDTAQVLLLSPPDDCGPAVDWLLGQQSVDGGWGEADVPLARHTPTLASVLALRTFESDDSHAAVTRGLDFLSRHADEWRAPLPEDIPVGVELLLPRLLDNAAALGVDIRRDPYQALFDLGTRRRALIAKIPEHKINSSQAVHSWEAWGESPSLSLLNSAGAVGDSPAATACFLAKARGLPEMSDGCKQARRYLERASRATEVRAPGVVPTAWPINRFEQAFGLYALCVAGLHTHAALVDVAAQQLTDLGGAFGPAGLAVSDSFIPDGDDTAAALFALRASGRVVDPGAMKRFEKEGHFFTWSHELQPSITVNARAIHALALFGEDVSAPRRFILERQQPDGRWSGDKWNCSWVYTTAHALLALGAHRDMSSVQGGVGALIAAQYADGGWGAGKVASSIETAWCALALRSVLAAGVRCVGLASALQRAYGFLLARYTPFRPSTTRWWLAKETFGTTRLDRVIELAAMLALCLDR